MQPRERIIVELTVVGKDRKGVVASFTNLIFKIGGNIESINQNVVRDLFGMQLEASFAHDVDEAGLTKEFRRLGKELEMEVGLHYQETHRHLNLAILVTKESQCLEKILDAVRRKKLKVKVAVVIGSEDTLGHIAKSSGIPFYFVSTADQEKREAKTLTILQKFNVDFIALARYMRILSPNFVWRYPNKIINIHPSLLPAFPGAFAYEQAFEKGARIVGCTSHFVTMDLDEGPIIWQESFKVYPDDTLQSIRMKGREHEAEALLKALQLYSEGKLEVRWGKVAIRPR
ncbi:MAG: formyltetrahydrofolate deformylase [Nitrososphaerales archaeon]